MNTYVKTLTPWFVGAVLCYLIGAFLAADWSIVQWGQDLRFITLILWIFFSIGIAVRTAEEWK